MEAPKEDVTDGSSIVRTESHKRASALTAHAEARVFPPRPVRESPQCQQDSCPREPAPALTRRRRPPCHARGPPADRRAQIS